MGWLIALAVLVVLACLPVGIRGVYEDTGVTLKLLAGPVRITLIPAKKKETPKKAKAKKEKTQKVKSPKDAEQEPKEKGGSWTDFLPLVKVATGFLGDFRQKLRVNHLVLRLCMAGDDPCDLAINYGRAWAAVGNLMPQLERFLVIKKRDISVNCDFEGDKTTVYVRGDITITVGRLLSLAVRHGWRGLKEFLKILNKRKGGAET